MRLALRRGLFFSLLLALTLPLVSCDSGGSSQEKGPDTLIPLEEGNQWTISGPEGERITFEVDNSTTLSPVNEEGGRVRVENNSDGTLLRGPQSQLSISDPAMFFKYPVEDGETYSHTDGKPSTFQVTVSTGESVIAPAGEFECILYEIERQRQGGNFRNDYDKVWVKPGLGPVRAQQEEGESFSLVSTTAQ